ncbi:MAG: ATP-binding protein [Minicystis sp.]
MAPLVWPPCTRRAIHTESSRRSDAMRLVAKLTAALFLAIGAVFALHGYFSVQRERAIVDAYRQRGDHLVLEVLSTAVRESWRRAGSAAALQQIAAADTRPDGLALRWVWLDLPSGDPQGPTVPIDPAGSEIVRVEQGAARAFFYAPVDVGEGRAGALELAESIDDEEHFLQTSGRNAVLTALGLVAGGSALALALGAFFVGRPVRRIVDKMQRIGEGDLDAPLTLRGQDELTTVADAINRMCARLAEARVSLTAETEARIRALSQLRHADRLTTVGTLASGIAHELGTPLNVVGGRAKRILRGAPAEEVGQSAKIIVEQVDRMTAIIRQLLDFARRRGAQKTRADLATLARGVTSLLSPLAVKRSVTIRLEEPLLEARAEVDAGQIQQALTNLMMNGIQAMREGGELTVRLARARVTPPAEIGGPEADYVALTVRDQGAGISVDHLSHVFEPFFTTKEVGEGTGLGLSVTWGIAREHEGWIDVQSDPGQGATFTLYLPASRVADSADDRPLLASAER